jgi:hypothetical protein
MLEGLSIDAVDDADVNQYKLFIIIINLSQKIGKLSGVLVLFDLVLVFLLYYTFSL